MIFSSPLFIFVFLPCVFLGYYFIFPRFRNIFLLFASIMFYAWGGNISLIVLLSFILVNYVSGLEIDRLFKKNDDRARKIVFYCTLMANLGLLFYFKYFSFTVQNVNRFIHANFKIQDIALPAGISFFTFHGISYMIDLYRRQITVQRNPLLFALHISVFPKLIAGPIVRYADVSSQLVGRVVTVEKIACGLKRFIIGLSKKVLIANVLGDVADKVFATSYTQIDTPTAWAGAICYMMQIFFDFSGYSDMAIGLGKMFGFDFMENFNLPYVSQSITEFWRRWHISLATWFRDYVFLPISYAISRRIPSEKVGRFKTEWVIYGTGIFVTWLLIGFWHGASWTFMFWGIWHGIFIVLEKKMLKKRGLFAKFPASVKWAYTMFIVLIGWVIFRSNGMTAAYHYLQAMGNIAEREFIRFSVWHYLDRQVLFTLLVAVITSSTLPSLIHERFARVGVVRNISLLAQPLCLLALFILNIIFMINNSYNPFIYFQF